MSKKILIFKLSCALFWILFLFLYNPSLVKADSIQLKVSPSVLRIEAKPPADVWTPFTIQNLSDQPISLKIGYKAFNPQLSSNGNIVFLENGQQVLGEDKKIFDKMQIVDDENVSHDSIELGPKQQERFRLRILLPQDEPNSDYYFTLIFLQNMNQIDQYNLNVNKEIQKTSSLIQTGIGLNVLLAVGDEEIPSGVIQTYSTPLFSSGGSIPFILKVANTGDHFAVTTGEIKIKNIFGMSVGQIKVPSSVILAGTTRVIGNVEINTGNDIGGEQELLWSKDYLPGLYSAALTLNLEGNGPTFTRSIIFFNLPVITALEFLVILVLLIYIYLRVKKKLR